MSECSLTLSGNTYGRNRFCRTVKLGVKKDLRDRLGQCFPKSPHNGSQYFQKPVEIVQYPGYGGTGCLKIRWGGARGCFVLFSGLAPGDNGHLVLISKRQQLNECRAVLLVEKRIHGTF